MQTTYTGFRREVPTLPVIREWLGKLGAPHIDAEEHYYWIDARNADADQGPNYCHEHAVAEVQKLNAANPDHEYHTAGGMGGHEDDTPVTCEVCGKLLHYSLSRYGVRQELEHFDLYGFDLTGEHQASEAAELLAMLDQIEFDEENFDAFSRFLPMLEAAMGGDLLIGKYVKVIDGGHAQAELSGVVKSIIDPTQPLYLVQFQNQNSNWVGSIPLSPMQFRIA